MIVQLVVAQRLLELTQASVPIDDDQLDPRHGGEALHISGHDLQSAHERGGFLVAQTRCAERACLAATSRRSTSSPMSSTRILRLLVIYARICTKSYIFRRNKAIVEGCLLPVLVVLVVLIAFPLDFLRLITYS